MSKSIISKARKIPEGEGAIVRRAFPTEDISGIDPFVLFDEFFVEPPAGFPMHSHQGFEAITYMLEGAFVHEDSSGASGRIESGEVQHMITGKGLEHSENPGTQGVNHGLQLWIKLPKKSKKMKPRYNKITRENIPISKKDNKTIKTILGKNSKIGTQTPVSYNVVKLEEGKKFSFKPKKEFNTFLYVISGKGKLNNDLDMKKSNIIVIKEKNIKIKSLSELIFALISGKPLNESVELRENIK